MNALFFSPVIERAMRLAARCHRHQNRKLSDLPYISHPASVALILSRSGFNDEDVLAAALLHDVVEDTDYTLDELSDRFPPKVAEYVAALTERKLDDAGRERPWLQRKQEHIEHVAGEPLEARAIILADKLHNLGTISYDLEARDSDEAREGIWRRFNATREQILWYYRTMVERAAQEDERLEALASACRELLAKLETIAGDSPPDA